MDRDPAATSIIDRSSPGSVARTERHPDADLRAARDAVGHQAEESDGGQQHREAADHVACANAFLQDASTCYAVERPNLDSDRSAGSFATDAVGSPAVTIEDPMRSGPGVRHVMIGGASSHTLAFAVAEH
jgi:hypothetical protein